MRIYVFTEHYPNTFKPYFDTQFAELLRQGHDLRIFAFGRFDATLSRRVRVLGLSERTTYTPLTLRHLPFFAPSLVGEVLDAPLARGRQALQLFDRSRPARRLVADLARSLLLPVEPPDLCLIHNLVTAQSWGFLRALYPRASVCLYFHGGEIPGGGQIDEHEARRALTGVDRVFTNTAFSRAQVVERGCDAGRVVVVPVGFDLADYVPPERKRYLRDGVLRLLSVGRLSPEKGLHVALEAVAALVREGVRVQYRIVGAGPEREALERAIEALGLKEVARLEGEKTTEAVVEAYAESDALLLPSLTTARWAETQACVVQEAMLMKLAVVATRAGGVPESLSPSLRRFLVPPGDAGAMADALRLLAGLEEAEWTALGLAGRRFAERRYDIRRLTAELLEHSRPGHSARGQRRPGEHLLRGP